MCLECSNDILQELRLIFRKLPNETHTWSLQLNNNIIGNKILRRKKRYCI